MPELQPGHKITIRIRIGLGFQTKSSKYIFLNNASNLLKIKLYN